MPASMWKWWLAAGSAVVGLYVVLPGNLLSDVTYLLVAISTPVAIVLGIRRFRPASSAPWYWLAVGESLFFVAEVIWLVLARNGLEPFPSVADVTFLLAYPCLAIGVALFVRHRTAKRQLSSILDASIVSVGAAVVTWVLVLQPLLGDSGSSLLERVVSSAYPMLDLLVLTVVARLAFGGGRRVPAFFLLTMGLSLNLAADLRYLVEELAGTYAEYGLLDGGWLLAYLLIGAAALHPSMTRLTVAESRTNDQVTPMRLAALTTASITAPFVLLLQWLRGAPLEVPVVAGGAIVMFGLVVVRLSELGHLVATTRAIGEARFRSLVHNATDVIVVVDADSVVRYASPAVQRMWGHRPETVVGAPFSTLLHPDDVHVFDAHFATALQADATAITRLDGRAGNPAEGWCSFEAVIANLLHDPSVAGVVLTCRDTTERKALEAQLTHQAFHDSLTGLANRALFVDRVEHALDRSERQDLMIAVLFIDLDDFKTVNDGLGHSVGDALLIEVARRVTTNLRPGDTAARLGGDEFAVLVEDVANRDAVTRVARRVLSALQTPFVIDQVSVAINASVGIASRATADSAAMLIRDADIAMYQAKTDGKGRVAWFDIPMRTEAVDRWALRADLRAALRRGEFFLVYQPIVDLADDRVIGAEALLRWQHPTRGLIRPDEFIPVAEQSGLIVEIGDWVLRTATQEASSWQARQPSSVGPSISINVSAVQLRDPEIVTRVRTALEQSGIPADTVMLELTESTLMEDVAWTRTVLEALKALGIRVAVDDFGTGYSSLAYLRQFPVDLLKIDRAFINELGVHDQSTALAQDIITIARALNVGSIAEGIETEAQLASLQAMQCTMGQGYHLGRPMSPEQFVGLLEERDAGMSLQR